LRTNRERLEFGFYIGEHGSNPRERFTRNCKENSEVLPSILQDSLADSEIVYGRSKELSGNSQTPKVSGHSPTWEEWLREQDKQELRASVILPKHEVLSSSKEQLISRISQTFEQLYPLVLLATMDDPMPVIAEYLDAAEGPTNPPYSLTQ
jgi:5-methylcytosine-specific restriction protein B